MKTRLLLLALFLLVNPTVNSSSEWSGTIKQGYQSRQQFFEPTSVQPWLSDAVTSATPTSSEDGAVTELTTSFELDLPVGLLTMGLYGRLAWYTTPWVATVNNFICDLILPMFRFDEDHHSLTIGRLESDLFGSGLLVSRFPGAGLNYNFSWSTLSSKLFYIWQFERSDFQKEWLTLFGLTQSWTFDQGVLGLLYINDQSGDFEDKSRGQLSKGGAISTSFNWSGNKWRMHSELAYNQAIALIVGLDTPFLLQTRFRFMDQGYNPVLGRYAREGEKQSYATLRLPISLFANQVKIRPQWGAKHTVERNYWVPGISLDLDIFETLSITGLLVSEQPMDSWGAKEHFEYTQLNIIWVILPELTLSGEWRKTYNGFLNWKEIQSRINVEWQW